MPVKNSSVLMIRPVQFGFNPETAESNAFQQEENLSPEIIQQQALEEFDAFAKKLKANGIDVIIFEDILSPPTPDSIFPNNWISFHGNKLVLYPMLAVNRRNERRADIIKTFTDKGYSMIDLSSKENNSEYLEGTGSIVFDYEHKIAYANLSPRTNMELLEELCSPLNYTPVIFTAVDEQKKDIYHTNVLMCIGAGFAVLCTDCFPDQAELTMVTDSLKKTGHEIIEISYSQMNSFAGNMYQLYNDKNESFIVMSEQAFLSLLPKQIEQLEKYGSILHSPLYTIEKFGGGSARCMIAEIVMSAE